MWLLIWGSFFWIMLLIMFLWDNLTPLASPVVPLENGMMATSLLSTSWFFSVSSSDKSIWLSINSLYRPIPWGRLSDFVSIATIFKGSLILVVSSICNLAAKTVLILSELVTTHADPELESRCESSAETKVTIYHLLLQQLPPNPPPHTYGVNHILICTITGRQNELIMKNI